MKPILLPKGNSTQCRKPEDGLVEIFSSLEQMRPASGVPQVYLDAGLAKSVEKPCQDPQHLLECFGDDEVSSRGKGMQ